MTPPLALDLLGLLYRVDLRLIEVDRDFLPVAFRETNTLSCVLSCRPSELARANRALIAEGLVDLLVAEFDGIEPVWWIALPEPPEAR